MPFVRHRKLPWALSLIHDVRHQAQIAFNEDVSGVQISLVGKLYVIALLLPGQRLGEGAGGQLQRVQQCAEHQPSRKQHHTSPQHTLFAVGCPFSYRLQRTRLLSSKARMQPVQCGIGADRNMPVASGSKGYAVT